jgi:hypothetical protein
MRRFPALIVVTTATIALLALTSAVAGAVVIGSAHKFRYVQTTATVSGGGAPFMGSTDCGSGFAAVSGGTVASGTVGEMRGDGSFTTGTHQLWRSTGFNTGFAKNVSTVAICRMASPNIAYAKQTATLPASPSVASAEAKCPLNRRIAGGGVALQGPLSQVHVSRSIPDAVAGSWKATVVNDSGGARSFTVYAVCLPVNAGLGYLKFSTPEPANPSGFDTDLGCGSGAIPLTGGVSWSGNQHQVRIASAGPVNSSGGVNTIPDTAWRVGTANVAGAGKTETSEVICAPA